MQCLISNNKHLIYICLNEIKIFIISDDVQSENCNSSQIGQGQLINKLSTLREKLS